MFRPYVISAFFWRNLKQYFAGVLGYVVIVAFVTVSAVMTFNQQFFADNVANLDQLSRWFPFLLLFLAPAITMASWADERRSGTDAILFTLPASDLEITLGKYFAAAAVYTIALLFSLSQLISIQMLGTPDWGVMFATYFGYWLAGLAMLAIGMFASSLTDSTTVAFVLGALFCAIPVLIGVYFRGSVGLERLGVEWNLQDFLAGVISVPSLFYFASLTALMLYLNLVVIGRRHWSRGREAMQSGHYLVRTLSLVVGLVALNYLAGAWSSGRWSQADLTAERLYTLSPTTVATLAGLGEEKKQVTLKAYVSKDVPRDFVQPRKNLLNLLRQYDSQGGNSLSVEIREVEPYTDSERAALAAGVEPRRERSETGGKIVEQEVFMGAVISAPEGDVTIPAIDGDTAIEYELTRGIASASSKQKRITLGIVDTDTHFGGPEFEGQRIPWAYARTLDELEKMYRVQQIPQSELALYVPGSAPEPAADADPAAPTPGPSPPERTAPEVLLVADPSSLDDAANTALKTYIAAGHPVILLCDPLPFYWTTQNPTAIGVLNAPLMPRVNSQSPYAQVLTSAMFPKAEGGTCSSLMDALGVEWNAGETAWNLLNPHPNFSGKWPEFLGPTWPEDYGPFDCCFVYCRNGGEAEMIRNQPASGGLDELLFFYPGSVRQREDAKDLEFVPLVSLGKQSGTIPWAELTETPMEVQPGFNPRTGREEVVEQAARSQITGDDLIVLKRKPATTFGESDHVVAALIQGQLVGDDAKKPDNAANGPETAQPERKRPEQVIIICDLDFVSDFFHTQQRALGQPLDNLRLLFNSIETLAGDPEFVALRNRRPRSRTLETVEQQVLGFRELATIEQRKMEQKTDDEIQKLQQELDEAAQKISEDESLNFIQKSQQAFQKETDANARLSRKREQLENQLKADVANLRIREREQVSGLENRYRTLAILLAPLPALLLGIGVLISRAIRENSEVRTKRDPATPGYSTAEVKS